MIAQLAHAYPFTIALALLCLWLMVVLLWYQRRIKTCEIARKATERKSQTPEVLEFLPLPTWVRNPKGQITYCNPSYARLVGLGGDESQIINIPELHQKSLQLFDRVIAAGTSLSEASFIISNGARRLHLIIESPYKNGSIGLACDIQRQEELKQENSRFRAAQQEYLENAANAMVIFGPDMRILAWNANYERLWDLTQPYLSSHPTYGEILDKLRAARKLPEQANFATFKEEQLGWFRTLREPAQDFLYLPDGRSLRMVAIPYADGGLLITYDDMSDRLALERSYNATLAVQRATLDNLYEAVAVFQEDGRLRLSNPRFTEMWHLDGNFIEQAPHLNELLEKIEFHFDEKEVLPEFRKKFLDLFSNRQRLKSRVELIDGRILEWVGVPLPDGSSFVTFLDVTDAQMKERALRERAEILEQADSIKTKFLENVSYQLRSPLTSIRGFSEVLKDEYFGPLNPKQKEYSIDILAAADELADYIDSLLDVASIQSGYIKLNVSEFDLYQMLASIYPYIQDKLKARVVQFDFTCSPTIGRLRGDEKRLRHAIIHVLEGMIKLAEKGSVLKLSVTAEDDRVSLKFQETYPHAQQPNLTGTEHIAVSMSQSAPIAETKEIFNFAIVKNLIALHGGTCDIRTVSPSSGHATEILITLDRHAKSMLQDYTDVQFASAI